MANIVASGQITLVDLNDAKSLAAYIQSNQPKIQIRNGDTGALTPDWSTSNVVLTPELYVSGTATNIISQAKSIVWYEAGNPTPIAAGNGYAIGATNPKALTISQNKLSAGSPQKTYIAEITWTDTDTGVDVVVKTEIEFAQVASGVKGDVGTNALTAFVSNESVTLQANSSGTVSSYTGSGTDIYVYDGATALTYDGVGTGNGKFKVTATGTGITVGAITAGTGKAVVAAASNMTTDVATISYRIEGKTLSGAAIDITKIQSFSKAKAGIDGTTPTTYWMSVSAAVVQKTIANVLTPSSVTATGFKQVGTGSPVSDASYKFIVSVDSGSGFVDDAATGVVASVTKAVTAAMKAIRFRMYPSSVTPNASNFIDEQTVPIVSDGATGADAVIAYAWTPNGNTIKNSSGSLQAQADLYKGGVKQTSGVTYLWYKLVGGSWTALTSAFTGYNTATLTIPASEISGTTSYKAKMTYGGQNYEDVVTVVDQTDPIQAVPISAEGTVFKNGIGTKNVTGKLYQSGIEIDAAGTAYDYKWFMRNAAGTIDPNFGGTGINFMTGKTITITQDKVTNIGNLVLEVWSK